MTAADLQELEDALTAYSMQTAATGAFMGFFFAVAFAWYILTIIAAWRIIEKAGDKGWKALIPIYNVYILFKVAGCPVWFWPYFGAAVVSSIVTSIPAVATDLALGTPNPGIIILLIVCVVACIVATIKYSINMAKAFGKGAGFAVGLFFLQPIFEMILGFGKAKYNKKFLKEAEKKEEE